MVRKKLNTSSNPLTGKLIFQQNAIPPLSAGDYVLRVEQTMSSKDGKIPVRTYESPNQFCVLGPRFSIPPELISSVYPPEDANGQYNNVFPHICFTRKTLPWERSAGNPSGIQALDDTAPWLGLLLLDESEVLKVQIQQVTLLHLLSDKYKTQDGEQGKLDAGILYPNFPGDEHNTLEYNEQWSDPCIVIDFPVETFNAIAPSFNDIPWLAHVRKIQVTNTQSGHYLTKLKNASTETQPPALSTVIGNRLPAEGSESLACLVSLEQWAQFLPGEDGTPNPSIPVGITHVRMVLLKQWRFYAVALEQTFAGYLMNLNTVEGKFTGSRLQLPVNNGESVIDSAIDNAFNMGYVPINHHTRQGDQTVSWYKGPFLPCETGGSIDIPVPGPDSVTRYNPDTGMFDVSYAAAWQLGRLLALQNNNFAETLFNWKRENTLQAISDFEAEIISETLLEIVEKDQPIEHDTLELRQLLNRTLSKVLAEFVTNIHSNGHDENR